MFRLLPLAAALLVILLIIWPLAAGAGTHTGSRAVVRVHSDYPDLAEAAVDEIARRAEMLYPKLAAFFGHDVRLPIVIDLSDAHRISVSYPHANTIGFPRHVLERNMAVLAHEMTHLFMPRAFSPVLGEGIAIYVQDRFGAVGGFPNFGGDVDDLLRARLSSYTGKAVRSFADAHGVIARRGYHRGFGRGARRDAYLLAGSFTRYLFDTELNGDMAAFKRLYADGDFKRETGRTLEEIEAAWRGKTGLPAPPPDL